MGLRRAGWLCAACAALAALPAAADFYAGLAAYDRGDYAEAYRQWLPLAELGDASAQANVGVLCWRGQGVEADPLRAAEWFRRAAQQGNPIAQDSLGQLYYLGEGVAQDNSEAARWIRAAAEQGDANAQLRMGSLYAEGVGVERDARSAATWWRRSAEQGNAEAGIRLGIAYERGDGVPVDPERAQLWFDRAAAARAGPPSGLARGPQPADAPPAALAASGAGAPRGGVMIQIAAVASPEAAVAEWDRLLRSHPDLLGGLALDVQRVDLGEKGVFHRLRAGPLPDRSSAQALCERLASRDLDCVIAPEP